MNTKFSNRDNRLAELEVELSGILTEEINKRPHVGVKLLMAAIPVMKRVDPVFRKIEDVVGGSANISFTSYRDKDTGKRVVFASIKS